MRKSRPLAVILATLTLMLLSACGDDASQADTWAADLQSALERGVQTYDFPGAIAGVRFADGSIWTGTVGLADVARQTPMQADMQFRIGSITKSFTAHAVFLLAQDGLLDLDDPIETYLPGLLVHGSEITVYNLLNHASGLSDYALDPEWFDSYYEDSTQVWQPEALAKLGEADGLLFTPGDGAAYSNAGYIALGLLIEAVSGQDVESFFAERLIEPMGLSHSLLPTDTTMREPFVRGYISFTDACRFGELEDFTETHPSAFWTAGGMVSNLPDMLVWLGEIAEPTLIAEPLRSLRNHCDNPLPEMPQASFGPGVGCLPDTIGHTGAILGYTSVAYRIHAVDIVVLTNGYLFCEGGPVLANNVFSEVATTLFPDWSDGSDLD